MMFWVLHLEVWNGWGMFQGILDHLIEIDALHYGWGMSLYIGDTVFNMQGCFEPHNTAKSSNNQELWTMSLAVRALATVHRWTNVMVHIWSDNPATVSYINKMLGKDPELLAMSERLWHWALSRNITLECSHIFRMENMRSNLLSCWKNDFMDWTLCLVMFKFLDSAWNPHLMDAFAMRLNCHITHFASFQLKEDAL